MTKQRLKNQKLSESIISSSARCKNYLQGQPNVANRVKINAAAVCANQFPKWIDEV